MFLHRFAASESFGLGFRADDLDLDIRGDFRMETDFHLEVAKLERGVSILAMIASAAPMIGFLGTVTGMIRAFYNMSMAGNNIDIELLSSGIYEAMVTTVGGLIVGIIAYFFHAIISTKIQKVVNLLEGKATEFMDVLNEPA